MRTFLKYIIYPKSPCLAHSAAPYYLLIEENDLSLTAFVEGRTRRRQVMVHTWLKKACCPSERDRRMEMFQSEWSSWQTEHECSVTHSYQDTRMCLFYVHALAIAIHYIASNHEGWGHKPTMFLNTILIASMQWCLMGYTLTEALATHFGWPSKCRTYRIGSTAPAWSAITVKSPLKLASARTA